ncbi:MAG: transporter [Paraglaciecola chathamensis]
MNRTIILSAYCAALAAPFTAPFALADAGTAHTDLRPDDHAPIGVMGDHMHAAGEFMFSYRYMRMNMSDMLQGSSDISASDIATTIANPFAPPATVRVVPKEMTTNMHMLGFMYAPNDDITLMAMLNYLERDMDLTTFEGMMGDTVLGQFSTEVSGLADSKLGLLYRLYDSANHHLHFNLSWVIDSGSNNETDDVLTPMNMRMTMRLPYSMQLGSGSDQAEFGLTYTGKNQQFSWGGQVLTTTPLERNDEGYTVGDKYSITSWLAYQLPQSTSLSLRLIYNHSEDIKGQDSQITAPVTTANPANYGGHNLQAAIGVNTVLMNKHRIGLEYQMPINYHVNAVQMDMDNMLTLGYQLAF